MDRCCEEISNVRDEGTGLQHQKQGVCTKLFYKAIRFYQRAISPLHPRVCIYYPTCSAYALEAIEKYGARKGAWLGLKRLLRCHPGHKGGFDPVP